MTEQKKPLATGSKRAFGGITKAEARGTIGGSERLRCWQRAKGPEPRLWPGPSILCGLFHPNASKLLDLDCAMISAILILR